MLHDRAVSCVCVCVCVWWIRVNKLDLSAASKLDDSREVPILHVPYARPAPCASTSDVSTDTEQH
jgi:hypothetical protein